MKQESEAPIKFPASSVVKALFIANNKAKEETSSINGTYGDRVKTQIEIGNLHGPSFRHAASIYRKAKNNELKAREHVAHLRYLLDLLDEEFENAGHVGDLDRMSKAAAEEDNEGEGGRETAAEAANRIFTEQNRAAAGDALDLDSLKDQAPAAPEAASKPKGRGGRKKAVKPQVDAAPPAPIDDDVPAAPSPDGDDDDLRPAFLRRREEEREAGPVH